MADADTPYPLLRAELIRDGARPFITYYDDATGERVELSVITFDNWVSKTAGLLQDGLSVASGDRVGLVLPAHWQALVFGGACWAIGAAVRLDDNPADADVAVVGPDSLAALAGEAIGLSLRPLGGRFTEPLPRGVLDYAVEVPGYPDRFVAYDPPLPDTAGLQVADGGAETLAELVEQARARASALGMRSGARVLVPVDDLLPALRDALLLPLVTGGSAVLVRNEDAAGRDARVATERVDAVVEHDA